MKVGAVNADEHKTLARDFGVSGFPTIKIFGHDKSSPEAYNGARSASDFVDAAMKAAKTKVNMQLNGKASGDSGSKVVVVFVNNLYYFTISLTFI